MLIGSTKHTDFFAIKLHLSLCMYMHRGTLIVSMHIFVLKGSGSVDSKIRNQQRLKLA